MIVRILGEGQLDVDDSHLAELNQLDERVENAVDAGDEAALADALAGLLARVREIGRPLDDAVLADSDLILPGADSDLAQLRSFFDDSGAADGLIPG